MSYSQWGRKESDTTERLHFTLNCGGGNEDKGDLPQKIPCLYCHSLCPQPCSRPPPTHAFAGGSWTPIGKSPVGSLFLSPGSWCTRFCCMLQESYFPVLCKFWKVYGGVNGDLLQEDLRHIHTQSPCPCGRALATRTSTGDAQTQFCLRLYEVLGSWHTQGLFEPSERPLHCISFLFFPDL